LHCPDVGEPEEATAKICGDIAFAPQPPDNLSSQP